MQNLEFASLTGRGFSVSEITTVQQVARLVAASLKQPNVKVWGKILGATADYIVIVCHGRDLLDASHTLYSTDGGMTFTAVDMHPHEHDSLCSQLQGPFMGDAAYEYQALNSSTQVKVPIKESERLSWFIRTCDHHCRVVPRGAVIEFEDGTVVANRAFGGLDRDVAGRSDSYVHLRKVRGLKTALVREGVSTKLDFLDSIVNDVPKSVWMLKYDAQRDAVFGMNSLFLGALFYHIPESQDWGSLYVGTGEVGINLAFML